MHHIVALATPHIRFERLTNRCQRAWLRYFYLAMFLVL